MSRRKLWLGCLSLLALGGLAVAGLGVYVATEVEPRLRARLVSEAAARGVALDFAEIELGRGWVRLHDVRFRLQRVSVLEGRAETVTVLLDFLTPVSAAASNVQLDFTGSASTAGLELAGWARDHAGALRLPGGAEGVRIGWAETPGAARWLEIHDARLAPLPEGLVLDAPRCTLAGVELGRVSSAVTSTAARLDVGLGSTDPTQAPIHLEADHSGDPMRVEARLAPISVRRLGVAVGVPLTLEAQVEGWIRVHVPRSAGGPDPGAPAAIIGHAEGSLTGWVPPHPRELSGIVFGKTTRIETDLTLSPDRLRVALERTKVTAGAFVVAGSGRVDRDPAGPRLALDLRGNLACSEVARSAVGSHVTGPLGRLVGDAASAAVVGSVSVRVQIDADLRRPDEAKVVPSAGVGCGLRPLPTLDLPLGWLPPLPPLGELPALPGLPR